MKRQKTRMVENSRINDRAKNYEGSQTIFSSTNQDDYQNSINSDFDITVPGDLHIQKEISHSDNEKIPGQSIKKMASGEFWIFRYE